MERVQKSSIRVDKQGRALIPKRLREALGMQGGDEVIAWIEEGRLVLEPRAALLKRLQERYDSESDHVDTLLKMRREEVERNAG